MQMRRCATPCFAYFPVYNEWVIIAAYKLWRGSSPKHFVKSLPAGTGPGARTGRTGTYAALAAAILLAALCVSCARDEFTETDEPDPVRSVPARIVILPDAGQIEQLAAYELQRYLYRMSGTILPVERGFSPRLPSLPSFILATRSGLLRISDLELFFEQADRDKLSSPLSEGEHKSVRAQIRGAACLVLTGGRPVDVLHAVYSLLEDYGHGFSPGGETIHNWKKPEFPAADSLRRPVFAVRGMMPLAGGFAGRTSWNIDEYRVYFEQIAKMRCNLVAFHFGDDEPFAAYRDGGKLRGGEPLTIRKGAAPTKDYGFGTAKLFSEKYFSSDSAKGRASREDAIFAGQETMQQAIFYAARCGLQTVIGFDVGADPTSESGVAEFLTRIEHLLKTYPALDYICLHAKETSPEAEKSALARAGARLRFYAGKYRRDFSGVAEEKLLSRAVPLVVFASVANHYIKSRAPHVRIVVAASEENLAAGLNTALPDNIILATQTKITAGMRQWWKIVYADEIGIPFLPAAGVEKTIEECRQADENPATGIIFAHRRLRAVEMQADAFARCCWKPKITGDDFFTDFSARNFGAQTAAKIAPLLKSLDRIIAAGWSDGEGGLWRSIKNDGTRGELRELFTKLRGIREILADRNVVRPIERLDRILHSIRWALACDASARIINSTNYKNAQDAMSNAGTAEEREKNAREILALLKTCPIAQGAAHCAGALSSRSELGEMAQLNETLIADYRRRLESAGKVLGIDAVAVAESAFSSKGGLAFYPVFVQRLISPAVIAAGDTLTIRAIITHRGPLARAECAYRRAGKHEFSRAPLRHIGGFLYEGTIRPGEGSGVIEYYLFAGDANYNVATYPQDAPRNVAAISVLPPTGCGVTVVSDSARAALNRDFRLDAVVYSPYRTPPSEVVVNFCAAGGKKFARVRMEKSPGCPFRATLPANFVREEGVEYFLEIRDADARSSRHPRRGCAIIQPDFRPPAKIDRVGSVRDISGEVIVIRWSAPLDDRGVRRYHVYRRQSAPGGEGKWKKIGTACRLEFADVEFNSEVKYAYRVEAEDFAGNIGESSAETPETAD